jgi:hypothetical protein
MILSKGKPLTIFVKTGQFIAGDLPTADPEIPASSLIY